MLLVVVVGVVMVVRLLLCGGCDGGRCGSNRSGEWSMVIGVVVILVVVTLVVVVEMVVVFTFSYSYVLIH